MLDVMNFKMFEILKNQFKSNLQQDMLALSGFCSDEELLSIIEKCHDVCLNKSNDLSDGNKS